MQYLWQILHYRTKSPFEVQSWFVFLFYVRLQNYLWAFSFGVLCCKQSKHHFSEDNRLNSSFTEATALNSVTLWLIEESGSISSILITKPVKCILMWWWTQISATFPAHLLLLHRARKWAWGVGVRERFFMVLYWLKIRCRRQQQPLLLCSCLLVKPSFSSLLPQTRNKVWNAKTSILLSDACNGTE